MEKVMKKAKISLGGVKMKKSVLTVLAVFVLLISSFTFSSCESCKKDNSDDNKSGTSDNAASDIKTSDSTTSIGGATGTNGAIGTGGSSVNTANAGGGGSNSGEKTTLTLAQAEAAVRVEIGKALLLDGKDRFSANNPFFKAWAEAMNASIEASTCSDVVGYLDNIRDMYQARIEYVESLEREYGISARDDAKRNDTKKKEAENFELEAEKFRDRAEEKISSIIVSDLKKDETLIYTWKAFKEAQVGADTIWKNLCDAVNADANRPKT
jgi:hypothetical protein